MRYRPANRSTGFHKGCFQMDIALKAAAGFTIAASPFAGTFAATFVHNSLAGDRALKLRFHCSNCGHRLAGADLIPLYSWIVNSGACRYCQARIPLLYPCVEFAFLANAILVSLFASPQCILPAMLLGWTLIVLSTFDILAFVLPDLLTYALALGGLGVAASGGIGAALESAEGFLAGGASLLLVKSVYRLVAKRDGLGLGDVKLFAAAGAWVGCEGLPQVLLIASMLGLGFAALYSSGPKSSFLIRKIPFGAALCAALWMTWMWEHLSARSWVLLTALFKIIR
jgi:leader peptidase (prepilin peptidase)/N-methyltransferase